MIAALSTVVFLGVLLLVAAAAMQMLDERGSAIVAALKGRSQLARPASFAIPARINPRVRARLQRPLRAEPRLRAAA